MNHLQPVRLRQPLITARKSLKTSSWESSWYVWDQRTVCMNWKHTSERTHHMWFALESPRALFYAVPISSACLIETQIFFFFPLLHCKDFLVCFLCVTCCLALFSLVSFCGCCADVSRPSLIKTYKAGWGNRVSNVCHFLQRVLCNGLNNQVFCECAPAGPLCLTMLPR